MQISNVRLSVLPTQKVVVADMSDDEKMLFRGEAKDIPEELLKRLENKNAVIALGEQRMKKFDVGRDWLGLYIL